MKRLICTSLLFLLFACPCSAQSQADLEVLLSACEFFSGSPLTQQERDVIATEFRADFAVKPAEAAEQVATLRELGGKLAVVQDPFQLFEFRQLALGEIYKAHSAGERTRTSEVVLAKAAPLAQASNGLLLLQADLVGAVDFIDLTRQGQGQSPMTPQQREQLGMQILTGYPTMPQQAQAFIATSRLFSLILQQRLAQMSAAQQVQFRQSLAQQQPQNAMSMSDYQVLSNMSRDAHLSTMNILENMGDSGDYWSVVERPSW